jgi:hypothetical protein
MAFSYLAVTTDTVPGVATAVTAPVAGAAVDDDLLQPDIGLANAEITITNNVSFFMLLLLAY